MGIVTVLWEKWVEFRRDFFKITVAALISPLMYLVIFGMGIQTTSHGEPYLHFLIPGIMTMATMTGSFGAITQSMAVQRLYERALDQVMISPTPLWQFIIGQVIGGSLRGMYASGVIMLLTAPINTGIIINGMTIVILFLNGMVFSVIGLVMSFLAKNYSDAPRFNAYIIVPMSFLCNTFFSTEQLPAGFRQVISVLPLSQSCEMVRAISNGMRPNAIGFAVLGAYLAVFGTIAVIFIYRKKNL